MSRLSGQPSARVAIAQGTIYPSGLPVVVPREEVQATVRPQGALFASSAGFRSVRPGANRYQSGFWGLGIGFTPLRFAEDLSAYADPGGVPALVSSDNASAHADIADIPGSGMLDSEGISTDQDQARTLVAQGTGMPVHDGVSDIHDPLRTVPDMGDRDPGRPLTRQFYGFSQAFVRNPVQAVRGAQNHWVALAGASLLVGGVYVVARDFERSFRSRRGRGVASGTAAVPAAGVETAGREAARATEVAAEATEAAAGAVKNAGAEVEKATKEVAAAATE